MPTVAGISLVPLGRPLAGRQNFWEVSGILVSGFNPIEASARHTLETASPKTKKGAR